MVDYAKLADLVIGRFTRISLLYNNIWLRIQKPDSKLLELKDSHKGESCFIIGLGPSLTSQDLDSLHDSNMFTFSMNRCYRMFPHTSWRPNFYFISDPAILNDEIMQEINRLISLKIPVLYSKNLFPGTMPKEAIYYKPDLEYLIMRGSKNRKFSSQRFPLEFSQDASKRIYDGHTCVISILQLAYFMGFKRCFPLGVDCGAKRSATYSSMMGASDNSVYLDNNRNNLLIDDFSMLYQDMKEKHISLDVLNCTRGGVLEVFPRISLEDALAPCHP